MILRKGLLRHKLETALIRPAIAITRSLVVSRCDNNDMWYMAETLEAITQRISNNYQ